MTTFYQILGLSIVHWGRSPEKHSTQEIIIGTCDLTSKGVEDLSKALAHNSSLEQLSIEQNRIGDQGVAYVAESLKKNQTLKHLNISQCGLGYSHTSKL